MGERAKASRALLRAAETGDSANASSDPRPCGNSRGAAWDGRAQRGSDELRQRNGVDARGRCERPPRQQHQGDRTDARFGASRTGPGVGGASAGVGRAGGPRRYPRGHGSNVRVRSAAAVEMLLASDGGCATDRNDAGRSALQLASEMGNTAVIEILLAWGALVDATDSEGKTPLIAGCGHADVVAMLLEAGADANVVDRYGYSVLLRAAEEGRTDVVATLLGRGVDVNQRNRAGESALSLARSHCHTEVENALREAGGFDLGDDSGDSRLN